MSCANAVCSSQPSSLTALNWRRRKAIAAPVLLGWLAALVYMHERWRQRQTLLDLDAHLLRDIGITREQAEREAGKPFWK